MELYKKWVFQKYIETRPFKNRLDLLEQVRLALLTINGNEPNFIPKSGLSLLKEEHNRENRKLKKYRPNQEFVNIQRNTNKRRRRKVYWFIR